MRLLKKCVSSALPFLLPLLMAACAAVSRPGPVAQVDTSFQVFIPPGAQGYELPRNEKIVLGESIAQPAPVYPAAWVSRKMGEQIVCLEIEIDAHGLVYASRPLYAMPGCPASAKAVAPAFEVAARDAVMQWRFHPAVVCTFQMGVDAYAKGNDCDAEGAKVTPIAIKLAFAFTFTQTHGVVAVHTGALSTGE
jgi:hypothetical protein